MFLIWALVSVLGLVLFLVRPWFSFVFVLVLFLVLVKFWFGFSFGIPLGALASSGLVFKVVPRMGGWVRF